MNKKAYWEGRSHHVLAIIGVAMAASTAACGGDDSAGREVTGPIIPTTIGYTVDLFEGKPAGTEACNKGNSGVCPGWYPYDDGSLVIPDGGFGAMGQPPELEVVELALLEAPMVTFDPNKPSTTALHIHGGPYSGPWGAGASHQFVQAGVKSLEEFSGIVFWARRVGASESVMHLSITTLDDTAPAQLPPDVTPICHDPATPGKNDGCSDGFGIDIPLYQRWLPYVVYFSDLKQQGYGYKPPGGFDKKNATGINIGNKQAFAFDEYIDDMAFFK
jgi:hypothetical protein